MNLFPPVLDRIVKIGVVRLDSVQTDCVHVPSSRNVTENYPVKGLRLHLVPLDPYAPETDETVADFKIPRLQTR